MALESYKKEQDRLEKEEAKKAGTPEEVKDEGQTLKEIMADDEQNALLGDMVKHGGNPADKELFARLVSGDMKDADINALSKFRDKFTEKIRQAESIEKELTPDLARYIAENNPDIKKMIGLVSAEGIVGAVQESIKKVAMTDPEKFNKISKSVENIKSFREGDLKKLDDEVKEKCKNEGVDADKFEKVLAIEDGTDRSKAMRDLVRSEWGTGVWASIRRGLDTYDTTVAKLLRSLGPKSPGPFSNSEIKAERLATMKNQVDTALAELDARKKKLGSVLAASIKGNKDLLESMSREIIGAPEKKKESVGMNEVKKEMPDKAKLPEKFKKYRKNIANWDSLDETAKNGWRDKFLKQETDEAKKNLDAKGGFWAAIFGALFDTMFAGFDKKSLN